MDCTTIQISKAMRERLARLRAHPRETYDDILGSLLALVPSGDDEGEYSDEFRASLLRGMTDIRQGRMHSLSEARERLGIKGKGR